MEDSNELKVLKEFLLELKWQSKQNDKIIELLTKLRQPCGKSMVGMKKILEGMPNIKDHPMAPFLDQLIKLAEEGEKDGS